MGGGIPFRPVNLDTKGGVTYNTNEARYLGTKEKDGAIRHQLLFNTGVTAEYPTQKALNNASIFSRKLDGSSINVTQVNNLAFGEVKGSDKQDYIHAKGNNGTIFDVSGDSDKEKGRGINNGADQVFIQDAQKGDTTGTNNTMVLDADKASQNNQIITDGHDTVHIKTNDTDATIEGEGLSAEKDFKGTKNKDLE